MKKQTLYQHLSDLRKVFIKLLFLFFGFFAFSFLFLSQPLINFSSRVLGIEYALLNPLEPIIGKIELSIWISLILPFPIYAFLIYQFLEAGLYKREKEFAKKVLYSTFFLPPFFLPLLSSIP